MSLLFSSFSPPEKTRRNFSNNKVQRGKCHRSYYCVVKTPQPLDHYPPAIGASPLNDKICDPSLVQPELLKKSSHTRWTINIKIRVICLYNLYNKFKLHVQYVVWFFFFRKFELKCLIWEISSSLLIYSIQMQVNLVVTSHELMPKFRTMLERCPKVKTLVYMEDQLIPTDTIGESKPEFICSILIKKSNYYLI